MSSPAVVPPLPAGQSRGGPHRIVEEPAASHRTIRVGLLGFGTVGRGLYALLERRRDATARRHGVAFEITVILVRDVERARDAMPATALVTSDPERFLAGRFDVVVEAIGGVEPAARLVGTLLERGVDVVTANKALLADRWDALHALAAASGARLRWEASVAAGIPVVGLLRRSLQSTQVSRVTAILNATSNLVLTKIAWGSSLEDALLHARRQGFAEADPTLDVSGIDAAQKLAILVATIRSRALAPSEIDVQGIESVRPEDSVRAAAFGGHLKPIAFADLGDARPGAWIAPAFVPDRHPLARVEGTSNGVHLTGDTVSDLFLSGPGAGADPTAASLLDDLLALANGDRSARTPALDPPLRFQPPLTRWFVSVRADALEQHLENVLEVVAGSGLLFRELRVLREPTGPVLAGITVPILRDQIERIGARLEAATAVTELRAWRAIDAPVEEASR